MSTRGCPSSAGTKASTFVCLTQITNGLALGERASLGWLRAGTQGFGPFLGHRLSHRTRLHLRCQSCCSKKALTQELDMISILVHKIWYPYKAPLICCACKRYFYSYSIVKLFEKEFIVIFLTNKSDFP